MNRIKEYFLRIRLDLKATVIISIIGLIFSASSAIVGGGTPLQLTIQPRLRYSVNQLVTDKVVLTSCTVENTGLTLAEEIVVNLSFEDNIPFKEQIVINGGDRPKLESGGEVNDISATVYADRIVRGDIITLTLTTETPSPLVCKPTSRAGTATILVEENQVNSTTGFTLLLLSQIGSAIIIIWVLRKNQTNREGV